MPPPRPKLYFEHVDGDKLTAHKKTLFCICCLESNVPVINLLTCRHSEFLDNIPKPEIKPDSLVVCEMCHRELKRIKLFKQQVENSFKMLLNEVPIVQSTNTKLYNFTFHNEVDIVIQEHKKPETRPETKLEANKITPQKINAPTKSKGNNLNNIHTALDIIKRNDDSISFLASSLQTLTSDSLMDIANAILKSGSPPLVDLDNVHPTEDMEQPSKRFRLENTANEIIIDAETTSVQSTLTRAQQLQTNSDSLELNINKHQPNLNQYQINLDQFHPNSSQLLSNSVPLHPISNHLQSTSNYLQIIPIQLQPIPSLLQQYPTQFHQNSNQIQQNATQCQLISNQVQQNLTIQLQQNSNQLLTNINQLETNSSQLGANSIQLDPKSNQLQTNTKQLQTNSNQLQTNSVRLEANSTTLEPNSTRLEANSTRHEPNSNQLQPHSTQLEPNSNQLQPHSTQLEPNSNQLQPHSTQLEPNSNHLQPHSTQLEPNSDQLQPHSTQLEPNSNQSISNRRNMPKMELSRLPPKNVKHRIRVVTQTFKDLMKERELLKKSRAYRESRHKCEKCIIGFKYLDNKKHHMKKKHRNAPGTVFCSICSQYLKPEENDTHLSRHFIRYECKKCKHKFQLAHDADLHYKNAHRDAR